MDPYAIIKKLGKILRGGITAKQVFLGLMIGFAIGMIPGFNLTLVILLLCLFLFNSNFGAAVLAFGIGKGLGIAIAPLTFNIGYTLIHSCGLSALVKKSANTPVLAYLDLHVYCLLGGLVIALVVGIPFALFVSYVLETLRKKILDLKDKNEKVNKASTSKIVRFILWCVFGKQKAGLDQPLGVKSSWINVKRTSIIFGLFAVVVLGCYLGLNSIAKCILTSSLGGMNGAEVSVKDMDVSIAKGAMIIEGLEVAKRKNPEENRFSIDKIVIDFDMRELLCKRLLVSSVECNAVRTNQKRESVAEVYKKDSDLTEEEKQIEEEEEKLFKFPEIKSLEDLEVYRQKYEKMSSYFNKFKEMMEKRASEKDPSVEAEKTRQKELAKKAKSYKKLSASEFLTQHPAWEIQLLKAGDILVAEDAPEISLEAHHVSSNASLATGKCEFKVVFDESKLKDYIKNKITESKAYQKGKAKVDEKVQETEQKVDKEIDRLGKRVTDKLGEEAGEDVKKAAEDVRQGLKNLFKKK